MFHWQIDCHCVNEQKIGTDWKSFDSTAHGQPGGLENIDLIDLKNVGAPNGPAHTTLFNPSREAFALFALDDLAIVEAADGTSRVKYDGGGEDRSEKAAAANLIDAGYARKPALTSLALERAPATHGSDALAKTGGFASETA